MKEMRPAAADDPVAWCASLSVPRLRPAETAERVEVLFVVESDWKPLEEQGTLYYIAVPISSEGGGWECRTSMEKIRLLCLNNVLFELKILGAQ